MSKTAIIAATQGEFEYIDEWIQYHHNIGVDLILIGYNGPADKLKNYKYYDYVRYIDFSYNDTNRSIFKDSRWTRWADLEKDTVNTLCRQSKIYNILLFYIKWLYQDIKYCAVIDTDEFIDIKDPEYDNIGNFLENYFPDNNSSISIQMNFYTDNNIIYKDDRPCTEKFTRKSDTPIIYGQGGNKIIINMKHKDAHKIVMISPHTCSRCIYGFILPENKIALKHFWTKSLEEWIEKMNPDVDSDYFKRFRGHIFYDYFHGISTNELTDEKIKAIPDLLKKYNINYDIVKEEQDSEFKQKYLNYYDNSKNN